LNTGSTEASWTSVALIARFGNGDGAFYAAQWIALVRTLDLY